jgi:hypothetical protein
MVGCDRNCGTESDQLADDCIRRLVVKGKTVLFANWLIGNGDYRREGRLALHFAGSSVGGFLGARERDSGGPQGGDWRRGERNHEALAVVLDLGLGQRVEISVISRQQPIALSSSL